MLSVFGGAAPLANQPHIDGLPEYPIYLVEAPLDADPALMTVEGMRLRVTIEGRETTYAARLGRWLMGLLGFKNVRRA
jgi:hypothetical protein